MDWKPQVGAKDAGEVHEDISRDWVVLGALVALGIFLGRAQARYKSAGDVDPVGKATVSMVAPLARTMGNSADAISDFALGMARARSISESNRQMAEEIRQLRTQSSKVQELEGEISQMRKLLGVAQAGGAIKIPARVVGFSPRDNRLTLDAGSSKGIKAGLAVIGADGLVGIVQATQPGWSTVALIWSPPPFKIGAVAQRNPPVPGLLSGESPEKLRFELFDANSPVQVGDTVATSGFSDTIPGGIPIGRVVAVTEDLAYGRKVAQVFPLAQIGSTHEVLVLK